MSIPSVFLCHATADKRFTRRLLSDLKTFGVPAWFDEKDIFVGDSLFEKIQRGVQTSDYTIVVLSRSSWKRPWVRREISTAYSLEIESGQKRILPVLIENCPIPSLLKDKRYADFRGSYKHGLVDVLTALGLGGAGTPATHIKLINSSTVLDIVRKNGSLVNYEKKGTIQCLRDFVTEDVEPIACDGRLSDFEVSPGRIGEVQSELGTTYVKTLFPKPLREGQRLRRRFRMKMLDSFLAEEESWEGKQLNPANLYTLTVIFPKGRPPTAWDVRERHAGHTIASGHSASLIRLQGRQSLRLKVRNPEMNRSYVLRWWW